MLVVKIAKYIPLLVNQNDLRIVFLTFSTADVYKNFTFNKFWKHNLSLEINVTIQKSTGH